MPRPLTRRRVAITGVGLVSPIGIGTQATWDALLAGASGVGHITRFDTAAYPVKIAGEVKGFEPERYMDKKDVKKSDTFIHYALAASQFALEDSGFTIDERNSERVGVIIGSGIGGLPLIERTHSTLLERGPDRVSPFFIPGQVVNLAAGQVAIRWGARGPNSAPATACTTGLHAVGDAFRLVQLGYAEAMIAGGTESVITPLCVAGFASMRALSTRNDDPQHASRPWDRDRDGFVLGEGAGIVLLEEWEAAKARGARIYAEVVGYGMSCDAHHISAPCEDGNGARRVMQLAMEDGEVEPGQIDYINAHGTSTPLGDLSELRAVRAVFGEHAGKLAISSTKSSTGHLLGAAGGLEAGILALAMHHQVMPATLNLENPDPEAEGIDLVPHTPRQAPLRYAITNSFGFGGTNGAVVMKRVDD